MDAAAGRSGVELTTVTTDSATFHDGGSPVASGVTTMNPSRFATLLIEVIASCCAAVAP